MAWSCSLIFYAVHFGSVIEYCSCFQATCVRCVSELLRIRLWRVAVVCAEEGHVTTIAARLVPSPREGRLVKVDSGTCACPLCQLNLNIKHTVSGPPNTVHRSQSHGRVFCPNALTLVLTRLGDVGTSVKPSVSWRLLLYKATNCKMLL